MMKMHFVLCAVCAVYTRFGVGAAPICDNDSGIELVKLETQPLSQQFLIPKNLTKGFSIRITGKTNTKQNRSTYSLATEHKENKAADYENIACQLEVDFLQNKLKINAVIEGKRSSSHEEYIGAQDFVIDTSFTLLFTVHDNQTILLQVRESGTENNCNLEHKLDDLKYLIVEGDNKVETITFIFP